VTRALTSRDLLYYAKKLGITTFGVYSKDRLPSKTNLNKQTCGIVNLEDFNKGGGSHWVAFKRKNYCSWFFDAYGLPAPLEVKRFLEPGRIISNQRKVQKDFEINCGHQCLFVLHWLQKNANFYDIINKLENRYNA
jgi:hypothetical protein